MQRTWFVSLPLDRHNSTSSPLTEQRQTSCGRVVLRKGIGGMLFLLAADVVVQPPKKVSVDSFCVKPLAAFVPHLLLKNHVPCCPKCKSSKSVHTEGPRVKWVKVPKILFGTNSHNCLDTKRHWCSHCWSSFLGCDKQSMHLDAHQWTGFFPFNLSSHFAADEAVYTYIINAANQPTSKTQQQLKSMSTDRCHSEQSHHLHMATAQKI